MTVEQIMVEGSLDILWMNDDGSRPKYDLIFARYQGFRNGAQQPCKKIGSPELHGYLVELGFAPEDAKGWIDQVRQNRSVSIPNVMMPSEHLKDYGL